MSGSLLVGVAVTVRIFDLVRGGGLSRFRYGVSTCFLFAFMVWSEVSRRSSGFDLWLFSCEEDLVRRCRRVVSSYWLYGGFGLSFVFAVAVIVSLWFRPVVVYGPLKFWFLDSARASTRSSE
ncbi:hypothetical protein Bca4012_060392 [Brassica carinata]